MPLVLQGEKSIATTRTVENGAPCWMLRKIDGERGEPVLAVAEFEMTGRLSGCRHDSDCGEQQCRDALMHLFFHCIA